MFGLFIISLIIICIQVIKGDYKPPIPTENWANKELYYKDMMDGVSVKQRIKNLENGKYKLTKVHPEPHRDSNGKIVIENWKLYNEDLFNFGAIQTQKWVQQGKYNLTPKELEKELEQYKMEFKKLYNLS